MVHGSYASGERLSRKSTRGAQVKGWNGNKSWLDPPLSPLSAVFLMGSKNSLEGPERNTGCKNKIWILLLLEKAMAPHSSTLAWKIPWTEEPGRLQSLGSLRVGYD